MAATKRSHCEAFDFDALTDFQDESIWPLLDWYGVGQHAPACNNDYEELTYENCQNDLSPSLLLGGYNAGGTSFNFDTSQQSSLLYTDFTDLVTPQLAAGYAKHEISQPDVLYENSNGSVNASLPSFLSTQGPYTGTTHLPSNCDSSDAYAGTLPFVQEHPQKVGAMRDKRIIGQGERLEMTIRGHQLPQRWNDIARQASAVSDNLHENDFDEGLWSTGLPTSNTTNARSLIGVENFDHLSQAQIIDRTYNQTSLFNYDCSFDNFPALAGTTCLQHDQYDISSQIGASIQHAPDALHSLQEATFLGRGLPRPGHDPKSLDFLGNIETFPANTHCLLTSTSSYGPSATVSQEFLSSGKAQGPKSRSTSKLSCEEEDEITKLDFVFVSQVPGSYNDDARPRDIVPAGRRIGHLTREKRHHAARMRELRACWPCRIRKIKCGLMSDCRCMTSPMPGFPCDNTALVDYTVDFLPSLIADDFSDAAVHRIFTKNISGFVKNRTFAVELTCGPYYPGIEVQVAEFVPRDLSNSSFLEMNEFEYDENKRAKNWRTVYTPAIAIHTETLDTDSLEKLCEANIQEISKLDRWKGEVIEGETSRLNGKILKAIIQYSRTSNVDPLVHDAVSLYAMQYFMSVQPGFTDESANEIERRMQRPQPLNYVKCEFSQVVMTQIKSAMIKVLRRRLERVMHTLQARFYAKDKRAHWAPAFCAIIILCMVAELVEIDEDLWVVHSLDTIPRETSIKHRCHLDDMILVNTSRIFHGIMQTFPRNRKGTKAFNPLKPDFNARQHSMALGAQLLVERLRVIIENHSADIRELAKEPELHSLPTPLRNHGDFRKKNSGRLVSRFLQTFGVACEC